MNIDGIIESAEFVLQQSYREFRSQYDGGLPPNHRGLSQVTASSPRNSQIAGAAACATVAEEGGRGPFFPRSHSEPLTVHRATAPADNCRLFRRGIFEQIPADSHRFPS